MSSSDQNWEKLAGVSEEGGAARFEQELAAFFGLMAGGSQEPVLQKLAESMQKALAKAKEREDGDF
jgi:hypothetical protein